MVGGTVIGLARGRQDTLLHVRGTGCEQNDTCFVRIVERRRDDGRPVRIRVGDQVWWQDRDLMWTPAGVRARGDGCRESWDIHLPRVGYSH